MNVGTTVADGGDNAHGDGGDTPHTRVAQYLHGMPEQVLRTLDLPPTLFVGGIPFLPVGGTVIIYGEPGTGKSFIQQGVNHTVAWGKPIHGFSPETLCDVLYCDFEANDSLARDRSLLLTPHGQLASDSGGARMGTDIYWLWSEDWKGRTYAEHLAELEERLIAKENQGAGFGLVVLDTYTGFMCGNPKGDNAYDLDQDKISQLNALAAKYQCCIVLIHHPNKGGQVSGSVGRSGTVFQVLKFSKTGEGEAVLEMEKNRVGPQLSFSYSWDRERIWRMCTDITAQQALAKGNFRIVLDHLVKTGGAGRAQLLRETGLRPGSLDYNLNRLHKRGDIELVDGTWRPAFPAAAEQMPKAPEYRPWPKCPGCGFAEDPEYGCPNSRCERHRPANFNPAAASVPDTPDDPPQAPVRAARSVLPALTLDTSEMVEGDPKKGAIKASMKLMKASVQRDTARYRPSLFAEQPDIPKEEIWEGRNKWSIAVPDGTTLVRLDKNAAYLSAANTKLPIGPLKHDDDPDRALRDGRVGYHLIDAGRAEMLELPCGGPLHTRTERDRVWITTPTLKQLLRFAPSDIVIASYTAPGTEVMLRPWIDVLKEQRKQALETRDDGLYQFVKNCYSLTISTMGESRANWELRRPDWMHMIRAQAYANLWIKAVQAFHHGFDPVKVGNTDEIWLIDRPDLEQEFPLGTKLGQWKIKQRWIAGEQ